MVKKGKQRAKVEEYNEEEEGQWGAGGNNHGNDWGWSGGGQDPQGWGIQADSGWPDPGNAKPTQDSGGWNVSTQDNNDAWPEQNARGAPGGWGNQAPGGWQQEQQPQQQQHHQHHQHHQQPQHAHTHSHSKGERKKRSPGGWDEPRGKAPSLANDWGATGGDWGQGQTGGDWTVEQAGENPRHSTNQWPPDANSGWPPQNSMRPPKVTITAADGTGAQSVFSPQPQHQTLSAVLSQHMDYGQDHDQHDMQRGTGKKKKKHRHTHHPTWPTGEADAYDHDYQKQDGWPSKHNTGWGDQGSNVVSSKAWELASGTQPLAPPVQRNPSKVRFIESHGEALESAQRAFYSKSRLAKNRFHWLFSPDKDERVSSLLEWIRLMSDGLAILGFQKFLQSGERGALISNADYRPGESPSEPAFDWITFDWAQETQDRTLQESLAFYDPPSQVLVFVFLLSKSGNSMAIWRRKLPIPDSVRLAYSRELKQVSASLRERYPIYVDEIPEATETPMKLKKEKSAKRKWFRWLNPV